MVMNLTVSAEDIQNAILEARRGGQEARCICVVIVLALLLANNTEHEELLEKMYLALPGSDRLLVKDALRTLLRNEAEQSAAADRARENDA
jgi:hypothetical protein